MKRILILGSTGSIGTQALEVMEESPELEVVGLAAYSSASLLVEQAARHDVMSVAISDETAADGLSEALSDTEIFAGSGSITRLVESVDCDLVLNGVVGAAGLEATIATLNKGVDLALANKESLVVGGELVMELAVMKGVSIIPVDSEHSAVFQCLQGVREGELDHIMLTASGGPFLGKSLEELKSVTREDALAHPRWDMGNKITIDSATLMNKGLEIIEAHHLFDKPYSDIDVLVHPQSIVHSLVRLRDGSVLAQLGRPDMKLPIAYALNYPDRKPVTIPELDLPLEDGLTFARPDYDAFPCLRLAMEAGERGGGAPIVLNAANEVAVDSFLDGRLNFTAIAEVVSDTLDSMDDQMPAAVTDLEQIEQTDIQARARASRLVG